MALTAADFGLIDQVRRNIVLLRLVVNEMKLARALDAVLRKDWRDQPRVPAGSREGGQWTGGGGGTLSDADPADRWRPGERYAQRTPRGPRPGQPFPGATPGQQLRLDAAQRRADDAIGQVRKIDPTWSPRPGLAPPRTIDGAIREQELREAEARTRLDELRQNRFGDNRGPALDAGRPRPGTGTPSGTGFDAPRAIADYRTVRNMPDLLGRDTWPLDSGTVAVARTDSGGLVYGVNSSAPGFTGSDRAAADTMRSTLVSKYPDVMSTGNIGRAPNDSLYHAETTILLRMARDNGGSLAGRSVTIYTDRKMCGSCREVLPLLTRELGNPTIRFVTPGETRMIVDGRWVKP